MRVPTRLRPVKRTLLGVRLMMGIGRAGIDTPFGKAVWAIFSGRLNSGSTTPPDRHHIW